MAENQTNQKEFTQKEILKLYVNLVNILRENSISYFSRILNDLVKIFKESAKKINNCICNIIGRITESIFQYTTSSQAINIFELIIDILLNNFSKETKDVQSALASALSKVVQSTPLEVLLDFSDKVLQYLLDNFQLKSTKAKSQIFECLLCYLLAIEEKFKVSNPDQLKEVIVSGLKLKESACRKVTANFIYTLNIIKPFALEEYRAEIIKCLKTIRYDNCKNVREAVRISLHSFNDIEESGIKSRMMTEEFNESEGTPRNYKLNFGKILEDRKNSNSRGVSKSPFATRDFNGALSTRKSVFPFVFNLN